jgi:parallel beta-helix repeat protein
MTRSRPLKLAALALLVLGLGLGTPVGLAQRTITVCPQGCQYAKIQEAITAASEGDTIQVKAGTYQENLTIIKRLTLQGEGKDKVTIQGTVTILSTKLVTLSGFTVKGGQGVQIEDSTTIVLSDNAFVESTAEGLRARSSSITLRGNLISRNKSHGLLLVLGSKALITGNTITSNGGDGVTIRASQADLSDNIVRDNGGCGVRADADSTVTGSVTSANTSGNQAGNLCEKAVKLDTEPPTGSLTINDGADSTHSTTVTLRITANDPLSGVAEMRFSNDGRTWSDWEGLSKHAFVGPNSLWGIKLFRPQDGLCSTAGSGGERLTNVQCHHSLHLLHRHPHRPHQTGSGPWRSAPTGGCWHLAPVTTRSSCGMWPVAASCAPSQATPTGSIPWRSAPTGGCWPPAPMTRRSSCGTSAIWWEVR